MPGEEQMLEEFVGQLEPKVLGQVVKVVFDKMKLAGEAGSLLKIDEQIRDSIAAAKKQYVRETTQATDRKGQPLLFTQAAMDRLAGKPDQPLLFDLSDITDNQFFEVAEARVAETLRHFAEKAQSNMKFQRRLFSDDALRGFAFVDICHKRFDAILMNPPFGEATPDVKTLCNGKWSDWNSNILCAFMHCMWDTVSSDGAIGVIFDRTASVKATYESFRRSSLCSPGRMLAYVDLGWGVLDANVETAMAVLSRRPVVNSFCGDVRYSEPHEKESCLTDTLKAQLEPHFKVVPSSAFTALPNAIVGYDFPSYLLKGFQECPSLEDAGFKAYSAHTLKADKHNRVWWEVSQHNPPPFSQPMFNGSGYSPYSTSFREVAIAECEPYSLPRNSTTILRNRDVHGRPGVCFSKRGDVFCCHIAPAGMLFTQEGRPLPVKNQDDAFHLLALLNTPLFRFALNKVCGQHKSGGYLNMLPFRRLGENGIVAKVRDCLREANLLRAWDETQPQFAASFGCGNNSLGTLAQNLAQSLDAYRNQVSALEQECEAHARHAYQISELDKQHLDEFATQQPRVELPIEDISHSKDTNKFVAQSLLSFALGVAFGRWDVRKSIFERDGALGYEPFDPLPIFPPALLVQRQESLAGYPCEIQWDGILVDAEESQDDLIGRVHSALEVMFGNHSDHVVAEACDILGVSNLREYFRRSGRGGFWEDHVSRYTKSRRRAPIYWLLQSKSKRLSVWLYYQRIDGDTLLKVLRPAGPLQTRIGVEENKLEELRRQKQRASDSSKEGKRLACDIESQDEAVSELRDFEMKLRRVANLHLEVDLNDGVVLNIAPLWELVPWKEAKKYWDELMEGKYEWSSIGKQLREKGLVK
jgi:hypothetical protein